MPRKPPSQVRRELPRKYIQHDPLSPSDGRLSGGAHALLRRVGLHMYSDTEFIERDLIVWHQAACHPGRSLWSDDFYRISPCCVNYWRIRDSIEGLLLRLDGGRVSREIRRVVRADDDRFLTYLNWDWQEYWWRDRGLWIVYQVSVSNLVGTGGVRGAHARNLVELGV